MTLKELSERARARAEVLDAALELTAGTEPTSRHAGMGSYVEDDPELHEQIRAGEIE